jgi:hypothetical protein
LHGRPLPAIRLSVAPEHGTITVRRATLKATNVKQCLAAELPALVAFYRPKADSANDDRFELEINFAADRKQIQRFHVTISNGANEGQRIYPLVFAGMSGRSEANIRRPKRDTNRCRLGGQNAQMQATVRDQESAVADCRRMEPGDAAKTSPLAPALGTVESIDWQR